MNNVIQLLVRYGAHLLFIVLEVICFNLIINYNKTQREVFLNSSNLYAGKISEQKARLSQFVSLRDVNDSLMFQNANLMEQLITIDYKNDRIPAADSLLTEQYKLIPATVCNSTIHLLNNHITLCKGSREGIRKDMGVISSHQGVIGVVRNVSENYAHVTSILHSQSKISCAIKSRFGHGTLVWDTGDPLRANLESIPKHEKIMYGDTVITSGYSTIFPRGILVGKVETFSVKPGSNSYDIIVKLFNNPMNPKYGYVIQNKYAEEQSELENEVENE
ncbi:MAG: rod shape-determining protein MreC [Saprospiraceae bacterium]|jgi:rod shape-determining protein MreC|nr:rod shape-determining protein MreC [Saprospiraceae bacterium]MBK9565785.1 rod shape-determining protein MreC [Saprospiraceae bacterium]MBP6446697.1 rod shape-determining protein MreC [Saprospiraceae bacterium]